MFHSFATLWTATHQAPLSMQFSRQEYWSGITISSSRGSFKTKDPYCVSCSLFLKKWKKRKHTKRANGKGQGCSVTKMSMMGVDSSALSFSCTAKGNADQWEEVRMLPPGSGCVRQESWHPHFQAIWLEGKLHGI